MKKYITTIILLSAASTLVGQVLTTAGAGTGAFRDQITDPFGTPAHVVGTADFNATSLGWPNSGANFAFAQMIQFDVTGNEAALNNASNNITLNLSSIDSLAGGTQYSVWFSTTSSIDIQSQGNGGGNGLLATAALPTSGTQLGTITSTGSFDFDATSVLQSLDYSTDKQLYFRVQVDLPTSNPGGALPLGSASLDGSTLTIVPEPATYAAIFGLFTLGLVLLRRRQQRD